MNRSAVIFDLDGTLTEPYLDFDAIRLEAGIETGPILEAIAEMGSADRKRAEAILRRHEAEAADKAGIHCGAVEVVSSLRARGHPVAVLTRNARQTAGAVLNKHGFVVDALRTREDGAIKPSAEPVLSICAELGARPRRSWMVGDHLMDIMSGAAAGTHTVLMIGEKPTPDFAVQAEHVIRELKELLSIIPCE
jgi:HAD superfamily hydrolase (TIGR01509 family)